MDKRTIKELKDFFSKVKKPHIKEAFLFGSRATDDYLNNSDADVILISSDFEGIPFPKRGTDLYVKWDGTPSLELLCYTPQEFDKKAKQIGLVADAVSHGIKVLRG